MAAILDQAWLQGKVEKVSPKYYSANGKTRSAAMIPVTRSGEASGHAGHAVHD